MRYRFIRRDRRRRWSVAEKERLVLASFERPGFDVAREAGVSFYRLLLWRKQLMPFHGGYVSQFIPVEIVPDSPAFLAEAGSAQIDPDDGYRFRLGGPDETSKLRRLLPLLR